MFERAYDLGIYEFAFIFFLVVNGTFCWTYYIEMECLGVDYFPQASLGFLF
jgi:hypothetical protein